MHQAGTASQPPGRIGQAVAGVIDDLLQHLHQSGHEAHDIHRIRVDIKRLRAWLQLVRRDAGFDWRAVDRDLRDNGRRLSPGRDARVVLDTLKWLEQKAGAGEKQALALLRTRMYFDPEGRDIDWTAIRVSLGQTLERLRGPAPELDSARVVRRGLKRCYRRARREGAHAFGGRGTIEDLHELRKWVKYLYYQLGYANRARPGSYDSDRKLYDRLGNRLGRIHDLDLVKQRLQRLALSEECARESTLAARLTDRHMVRLRKSCRRLYLEGFQSSPSKFVRPLD